jgi:hypothetical protein
MKLRERFPRLAQQMNRWLPLTLAAIVPISLVVSAQTGSASHVGHPITTFAPLHDGSLDGFSNELLPELPEVSNSARPQSVPRPKLLPPIQLQLSKPGFDHFTTAQTFSAHLPTIARGADVEGLAKSGLSLPLEGLGEPIPSNESLRSVTIPDAAFRPQVGATKAINRSCSHVLADLKSAVGGCQPRPGIAVGGLPGCFVIGLSTRFGNPLEKSVEPSVTTCCAVPKPSVDAGRGLCLELRTP